MTDTSIFTPTQIKKITKVKKEVADLTKSVYTDLVKHCKSTGSIEPGLNKIVVAGGMFTSLIREEDINDVDIFILNGSDQNIAAVNLYLSDANLFTSGTKIDSSKYGGDDNDDIIRVISAIPIGSKTPVQFIFTKYPTREELIAHFDYEHCKVSYVPFYGTLHITPTTYNAIMNKKLIPAVDKPAEGREKKFLERGWTKENIKL